MIGLSTQIELQIFVQTHKSVCNSKKTRKIIRIGRCLPRVMGCLSWNLFWFKQNLSLQCLRNKETALKTNGFRRSFDGDKWDRTTDLIWFADRLFLKTISEGVFILLCSAHFFVRHGIIWCFLYYILDFCPCVAYNSIQRRNNLDEKLFAK